MTCSEVPLVYSMHHLFAIRKKPMQVKFRPRLIPTFAALAIIALAISLGRWQLQRAEEKVVLQNQLESRTQELPARLGRTTQDVQSLRFRKLIVRGEFIAEKQIYLDNKFSGDRVGYHVLTPMQIEGTQLTVLVNRGWIERGSEYPTPPVVASPSGIQEIAGVGALPIEHFLELSSANIQGRVWQNLTFDRVREKLGLNVMSVILLADNAPPGMVRVQEIPDAGIDRHRGYAFQWFSIAIAVFIVWLVVNAKIDRLK